MLLKALTGRSAWAIVAGFITLALLFLPDATVLRISAHLPSPLSDPLSLTFLLILPAALMVAAWLFYWGLALRLERSKVSLIALGLSLAILAKALHAFYWFVVWDATGDSLGGSAWVVFPALLVLFCSLMLFGFLPENTKLAGLSYLLLVLALVAVAARAERVDFRQLTESRAERVKQAIEAYAAAEGRYPQSLQHLFPRYALSLSAPVILFGQEWCYQAGAEYYRLGYLDREHWSSPILIGRVYAANGHSPLKVDVCQAAIDAYRAQHPEWDKALREYGRPTPTPDLGE